MYHNLFWLVNKIHIIICILGHLIVYVYYMFAKQHVSYKLLCMVNKMYGYNLLCRVNKIYIITHMPVNNIAYVYQRLRCWRSSRWFESNHRNMCKGTKYRKAHKMSSVCCNWSVGCICPHYSRWLCGRFYCDTMSPKKMAIILQTTFLNTFS